jgi:hypothetical protein
MTRDTTLDLIPESPALRKALVALVDELAKLPPDEIEHRCNRLEDRLNEVLEQRHPKVFAKLSHSCHGSSDEAGYAATARSEGRQMTEPTLPPDIDSAAVADDARRSGEPYRLKVQIERRTTMVPAVGYTKRGK